MQQIEGQVYYNCNSNNDIFHDATQVEDVIEDTYDDDNVNWKPINNGFLQPVGKRKGAIRMMYDEEQRLTLYIINYCSDSINNHSYDNPQVCTYCYGEHHILFDTDHLKEDLKSN